MFIFLYWNNVVVKSSSKADSESVPLSYVRILCNKFNPWKFYQGLLDQNFLHLLNFSSKCIIYVLYLGINQYE